MDSQKDRIVFLRTLPLLWLSLAFLAGIAAAFGPQSSLQHWLLLAGLTIGVMAGLWRRLKGHQLVLALALFAFFLGGARYKSSQPVFDANDLAYYNDGGGRIELRGVIIKPPVVRDSYIELRVRAEEIIPDGEAPRVDGLVLARVDLGVDWQYGDRVVLRGDLETPSETEDFSYRAYLARQGIYSLLPFASGERLAAGQGNPFWAALYFFHEQALNSVYRLYPDPEASLLAGILLGDESGLSDSLKTAFNDTGTRHIIAISGFNISIIAGFLLALFSRWLGLRRAIWLTVIGIAFYTLLVGAEASVVRAAIMGVLALVARRVGRQQFALNTLAFSAALMALVNPLTLWDVGFQLSFAATLGLIVYAEPIQARADAWLKSRLSKELAGRLRGPLYEFAFLTIAAQITTLPLLLYHFQRLSWLSLPANLLILPVQPALMVLGGLSVLLGLLWQPMGALFALVTWPLAAFTIRIVELLASLPWAAQNVEFFSLGFVFLYYLALLMVTVPALRPRLSSPRLRQATSLGLLAALSLWLWSAALAAPTGRLELTLLDVGGEAILIRTPAGRNLLINGGPSAAHLSAELGRHLSPFHHQLDWLVVAGIRSDQINAFGVNLERFSAAKVAWAITDEAPDQAPQLYEHVLDSGIPISNIQAGQYFELGDGARIHVLAVGEHGGVLLLEWENFRALLPLGLDFGLLENLDDGRAIGRVDLLVLADSGYAPLSPAEWLINLNPEIVWLAGNEELDAELSEALAGSTLLRTLEHGWLRVSTDGSNMWVESAH